MLSTSTSTSTYVPNGLSTSTSTEIRYSSTASTSTKYSGPNPVWKGDDNEMPAYLKLLCAELHIVQHILLWFRYVDDGLTENMQDFNMIWYKSWNNSAAIALTGADEISILSAQDSDIRRQWSLL